MVPEDGEDRDLAERALLEEALKKGSLIWLTPDARTGERGEAVRGHPRWYVWTEGHVYLLTGPGEQPDPGLMPGSAVRVVVPSKDTRHPLVTFDADVSTVRSSDPDWDDATAELAKERLNLRDADSAANRWTGPGYAVFRLTPRLPLIHPDAETLKASQRAEPVPTPATTSGRRPWVLHRRGRTDRPLS